MNTRSPPTKASSEPSSTRKARPNDIREACRLILGAFVIGLVSLWPGLRSETEGESAAAVVITALVVLAFGALTVWLARKLWLGKNWARWAMLGYLSLGWVLAVSDFEAEMARSPISAIIYVVTALMELFACWLLFFGGGAQWFTVNSTNRAASEDAP
jgi:hypothetical protein